MAGRDPELVHRDAQPLFLNLDAAEEGAVLKLNGTLPDRLQERLVLRSEALVDAIGFTGLPARRDIGYRAIEREERA